MGETMRAAINALLSRTGGQSASFMLVLATNRPQDLDPAVLDRMDEALEFPLPGAAERTITVSSGATGISLASAASGGAIAKATEVWSGLNVAGGTASPLRSATVR